MMSVDYKMSTICSKILAQLLVYFHMDPHMWVTIATIFFFSLRLTTIEYFFCHGKSNVTVYGQYWVDRTWCLVTTKLYTICSKNPT